MGNPVYEYRECGGRGGVHYHVTCGGGDLIGGFCRTEEEARDKVALLNHGAGTDDVLGRIEDHLFPTRPMEDRTESESGADPETPPATETRGTTLSGGLWLRPRQKPARTVEAF